MLLGIFSLIECIFRISNKYILAFDLFKSSIKLYSTSGIIVSFWEVDLPVLGVDVDGGDLCEV